MQWIDTHCHLYHDFGVKKAEELIREARQGGVSPLITVGVDAQTIAVCRDLAETNEGVFFTAGVHPHEASAMKPEDLEAVSKAVLHPKCVGVGELGLDYHYDLSPRDVQREVFRQQLALALKTRKPVIVHSREAEEDILAELKPYAEKWAALPERERSPAPGVLHCFTGTRSFGEACLAMGFYISFSGVITFKNSDELRESAKRFPLERLLVETDSPYLAPIPHRGKKCEPAMVALTGQKLAEVKGVPVTEVARTTSENAVRLFALPQGLPTRA